jgi:hypothetical protein
MRRSRIVLALLGSACGLPSFVPGEYEVASFHAPAESSIQRLVLADDLRSARLLYDDGTALEVVLTEAPEDERFVGCRNRTSSRQVETLVIEPRPLKVSAGSELAEPLLVTGCDAEAQVVRIVDRNDGPDHGVTFFPK